jgi:hypothetical protein
VFSFHSHENCNYSDWNIKIFINIETMAITTSGSSFGAFIFKKSICVPFNRVLPVTLAIHSY